MSRKLRTSFVGNPSAILFLLISREGVFQHPQAIALIDVIVSVIAMLQQLSAASDPTELMAPAGHTGDNMWHSTVSYARWYSTCLYPRFEQQNIEWRARQNRMPSSGLRILSTLPLVDLSRYLQLESSP